MSEQIKLRECPFCGGEATYSRMLQDTFFAEGNNNDHQCRCNKCGIFLGYFDTKNEVIKLWNTRTEDKRIEKGLEYIEKVYDNHLSGGGFVSDDTISIYCLDVLKLILKGETDV